MASTYTLISSQVLASSASTVTFSSIPATYTDLVLRVSARGDGAGVYGTLRLNVNGDTSTTYYSETRLTGSGSAASSSKDITGGTGYAFFYTGRTSSGGGTASTFGSAEIYIPSYTVTGKKPISTFVVQENNTTAAFIYANAELWNNTVAITQLDISMAGENMVTGSSFYLYGISNA